MQAVPELTAVTYGVSQKGKKKLIDVDGNLYVFNSKNKDASTIYWSCVNRKCPGRFKLFVKKDRGYVSKDHLPEETNSLVKDKHHALERLRELTLSVEGNVKAVDLVRSVVKELTPEVRKLLPSEECLLNKVKKWAKINNIQLVRAKPSDYMIQEGEEPLVGFSNTPVLPVAGTSMGSQDVMSSSITESTSNVQVRSGVVFMEPVGSIDENQDRKPSGLIFLKQMTNGHLTAVIEGQCYFWQQDLENCQQLYVCQEANSGCPVSVTVDNTLKRYELRGIHRHMSKFIEKENSTQTAIPSTSGASRNNASVDDYANGQLHDTSQDQIECGIDYGGFDDHDDEPPEPNVEAMLEESPPSKMKSSPRFHVVSTSSNPTNRATTTKPIHSNNVKTGERCFVCGDHLVTSEAMATSEEIFRKACCYLNVKSNGDWFPKGKDSRYYSFCESCTNEIIKISNLYKKVEEMQSLIFKQIENVEKRIADAEIVDHWMAEGPPSTAARYEGFRKQVMLNYRNKLRVRREVRFGIKTGSKFLEIHPSPTAQMFAKDPSETTAFRRVPETTSHSEAGTTTNTAPSGKRKTKGRPKSKRVVEQQEESFGQLAEPPGNENEEEDFSFLYDDGIADPVSDASEPETKFWKDDPSKLNVTKKRTRTKIKSKNEDNESYSDGVDNDDPDYIDDDNDSDQEPNNHKKFKMQSKMPNTSGKIIFESKRRPPKQKPPKQAKSPLKRSAGCRYFRFPDVVSTSDGRLVMEGIEIVPNPPGCYKSRPYNTSFTCGACGKICLRLWHIRQHICGHHLGLYKCHLCSKQYSDVAGFHTHMRTIHSTGPDKVVTHKPCEICGKPIHIPTMHYHRWTHLSEEERNDPQYAKWRPARFKKGQVTSPEGQGFMCDHCGKTFMVRGALKNHELTHQTEQGEQTFMCQNCGRVYKEKAYLRRHAISCLRSDQKPLLPRRFPCPKCPTNFSCQVSRYAHIKRFHSKVSSNDMPFSCPKCPRSFGTRSAFKSHKRVCIDGEKRSHSNRKQKCLPSATSSDGRTNRSFGPSISSPISSQNPSQGRPQQGSSESAFGYNNHFLSGSYF